MVICQLRRGRESQPMFHLPAWRMLTVVLCNQCRPWPVCGELSCVYNMTSLHLLGADGCAENRSGWATYVYPVFSVQVTFGAVSAQPICLTRLSCEIESVVGCPDKIPSVHITFCDPWTWEITFTYICVSWVGNLCRSPQLYVLKVCSCDIWDNLGWNLSLIHISEPTRPY